MEVRRSGLSWLSRVSPTLASYLWCVINFSYISLQNVANRQHERQKVGLARRASRLSKSLFFVIIIVIIIIIIIIIVVVLVVGVDTYYWVYLQSATILLQSATGITKCNDNYKVSLSMTVQGGRCREVAVVKRWPL